MAKQDAIALFKNRSCNGQENVREGRKADQARSSKEADIFNQIRAALEVHATIEEEIFYLAVKKARSENVKDEVREAYEEHKQIKSLLAQISSITPADETYDMKIKSKKTWTSHRGGRRDVSRRQEVSR